MNRRKLLAALAAGAGTALAGCASNEPTITTDGDGNATVRVRETDEYGDVLVDETGLSLYLFDEDEGDESACYGECVATWPPLIVDDAPTAGSDVTAELGTTERDGGATQVTADGQPLYYYAGDDDPGDTNGQGVSDIWWLLAPDGSKITAASTTQSGATETTQLTTETSASDGGY